MSLQGKRKLVPSDNDDPNPDQQLDCMKKYETPDIDDLLLDVIPHLFLPRKTPVLLPPHLEDIELHLLQSFSQSLNNLMPNDSSCPPLNLIDVILKTWKVIQPQSNDSLVTFTEQFCEAVKGLQNGGVLPIYLRNQNSTLIITKKLNVYHLATFRSSLPGQLVMSTVGSHSVLFPETRETIRNEDLLCSPEFASMLYQLCVDDVAVSLGTATKGGYSYRETRDVAEPHLVADWLIGLLVPTNFPNYSDHHNQAEVHIRKKMRDQVTFSDKPGASSPFRRSGMYMSLKVTVQLMLLEYLQGDKNAAKFLYKLAILQNLTSVTDKYSRRQEIDLDLSSQMLAKLGMRVAKLEKLQRVQLCSSSSQADMLATIPAVKEKCLGYTKQVVHQLKAKMLSLWRTISGESLPTCRPLSYYTSKKAKISRTNPNLTAGLSTTDMSDLDHKIPSLDNYLKKIKTFLAKPPQRSIYQKPEIELKSAMRYVTASDILAAVSSIPRGTVDTFDQRLWLYDTENYVKYQCSTADGATTIHKLMTTYTSMAFQTYRNDPVGTSQMILVTLKCFHLLDVIATEICPLLTTYKPEVNPQLFDNLLLPFIADMTLLDKLLDYFDDRERVASKSEILSTMVTSDNFSVCFAKQHPPMVQLRERILNITEEKIKEKMRALDRCREECQRLQEQVNEGTCDCEYVPDDRWYRGRRIYTCQRCRKFYRLRRERHSIPYYERALPPQENNQWAVIFELLIPSEYAVWRDALAFLKYDLLGETVFNGSSNQKHATKWGSYGYLIKYMGGLFNGQNNQKISLGSSCQPASSTYHTRNQLDVLTNANDKFIVENGMTCTFFYEQADAPIKSVRTACSFQLETTDNWIPYGNLQETLASTTHTQNSILARQYECHERLELKEFVAFGSLRAGHRVQGRNLYEAIFSGQISLEEEPVLALILQTIWQVGPRGEEKEREAHLDFPERAFALEFVDMLDTLVSTNEGNYSSSQVLLAAVLITIRVGELNAEVGMECYKKLQKWRVILAAWATKIKLELDKLEELEDKEIICGEKESLKKNLVEVLLSSLFSYSLAGSMKDEQDVVHWLLAVYKKQENIKANFEGISGFKGILINFATTLPFRVGLEKMTKEPRFGKSFHKFICHYWNGAEEFEWQEVDMRQEKGSVIQARYLENRLEGGRQVCHEVNFDALRGSFLVNGYCQSLLSSQVEEDPLFQRYFKDASKLRVQRDSEFLSRTVTKFHGRHYEFRQYFPTSPSYCPTIPMDVDNDRDAPYEIVIREVSEVPGQDPLVLVDLQKMASTLSNFFIDQYSHWLDPSQNVVYCRPDTSLLKEKDCSYDFILTQKISDDPSQISSWRLWDVRKKEFFLNPTSPGFRAATGGLTRLEQSHYINVTWKENGVTTAHLRRYNLRFVLQAEGSLQSVEYPGFCTRDKASSPLGTLIGLQQGLLLETAQGQQLLLVPHSSIKIKKGNFHQKVEITLSDLREPPCFVYKVDPVLKRLKGHNTKPAWLYLAALHAATSSSLPDPFTEVTGTEMAVDILQSAFVWTGFPYDKESRAILEFLKSLSPNRKFYGIYQKPVLKQQNSFEKSSTHKKIPTGTKGPMEVVHWPEGLSSMPAYDGFAIIIDAMLKESGKLSQFQTTPGIGEPPKEKPPTGKEKLRVRAYFMHLSSYNPLTAVDIPNYFLPSQLALLNRHQGKIAKLPRRKSGEKLHLSRMLLISTTRLANALLPLRDRGYLQKDNLTTFLMKPFPLNAAIPPASLNDLGSFNDLLYMDLRFMWLKIYALARKSSSCLPVEEGNLLTILLTAAAYRGAPMEQVVNLQAISYFASQETPFEFPPVPEPSNNEWYSNPMSHKYNEDCVEQLLKKYPQPFTEMAEPIKPEALEPLWADQLKMKEYSDKLAKYNEDLQVYMEKKTAYFANIEASCGEISRRIGALIWPCGQIGCQVVEELLESYHIDSGPAMTSINEQLRCWYRNYKLKLFIEEVQSKLNQLFDKIQGRQGEGDLQIPQWQESNTRVSFETKKCWHLTREELVDETRAKNREEIRNIFVTGAGPLSINPGSEKGDLEKCKHRCLVTINQVRDEFEEILTGSHPAEIIYQAGLVPRLDPRSPLKVLVALSNSNTPETEILKEYAGALGVLRTRLQQVSRCLQASNKADLDRETSNPGYQNWSPAKHPEWLLLQLELDVMIRPVQVQVARQMISMPHGNNNGVTQLNMGEGKTSVIVPMLCTTLAKKGTQLCRVTVLSSMFNMNFISLAFSVGGLLNRRVYSIPCRRDLQIEEQGVIRMEQMYKECLDLQGVLLTLPEYRLSFRLLAYDQILKKNATLGRKMLEVENWLRYYARDVLDESDELFNVKYQLVYTVGEHVPIDGGDIRWITCQRILTIVQKVGADLLDKYGSEAVELNGGNQSNQRGHEFFPFRLLSSECLAGFRELVAKMALEGLLISKSEKAVVTKFLTDQHISYEEHGQVLNEIFGECPDELEKVLLISGYVQRGVLELAFRKRWRVDYGINAKQDFRRMAVPFRAKDVAAEKTEFGHPDLAIILTHLSYYYSGLTDGQLQETFDVLKAKESPEAIYSSWIDIIPADLTPMRLQRYKSLNMKDASQKVSLFQLLRKHKMVVDFWLANAVFPRECKQFPGKLVMTAWDLCYERQRYPVTGFSGTNDSHVLLPLTISQQDLPDLQSTNAKMEEVLLQPGNEGHHCFPLGVTCQEILEKIKDDGLDILIDAGALMLELSNEQVASLWLTVNPNMEAAVYFTKENNLFVKCREDIGPGTPFGVSPYQGRLERCGVFLDDQHTRGTDLKFPMNAKACVTVGTRMKRDKLIQACMRMRKLGLGQCVTFYLSHEAHSKVMKDNPHENGEVTTKAVLNWVCQNTKESNDDGLLYWALAGKNYAQRLAAEDHFNFPFHITPWQTRGLTSGLDARARILASQCVDEEVLKLKEMYGQYAKVQLLVDLVPQWFAFARNKLQDKNDGQALNVEIMQRFEQICCEIKARCLEFAPHKTHLSADSGAMEEEQEKELELEKETEMEEERVVERPRKAKEVTPYLHPNVKNVVLNGGPIDGDQGGIARLCEVFRGTSFWEEVQPDCWRGDVYVTNDFVSVIEGSSGTTGGYHNTDNHLRPVQYLVSFRNASQQETTARNFLLVLSPFEVDELMPYFRREQTKCKLHMFSWRQSEKQDLLYNNFRLQLPSPQREEVTISESSDDAASLLLVSASLYFLSASEQQAFVDFLGLAPQPWSDHEMEAIDQGMITKTGFLLPEYRHKMGHGQPGQVGFQRDPTGLVKKILCCRHSLVSQLTHVMRLLEEKCKIEFPSTK